MMGNDDVLVEMAKVSHTKTGALVPLKCSKTGALVPLSRPECI